MSCGGQKGGRDAEGVEQLRPGKHFQGQTLCPICHVSVADTNRNTIQCILCEMWVHVSNCTDLKATDLIDRRVTSRFTCANCLQRLEMEVETEKLSQ